MADIDNTKPEAKADTYMNAVENGYHMTQSLGDVALRNFQAFLNQERETNPKAYVEELRQMSKDSNFSVHRGGNNNKELVLEFDSPYGRRNGKPGDQW